EDVWAVCRAIRQEGSAVPVLMLTARDAVEARIAGLDSGADDYLTKPFDFGELLARLRALIPRGMRPPLPAQRRSRWGARRLSHKAVRLRRAARAPPRADPTRHAPSTARTARRRPARTG